MTAAEGTRTGPARRVLLGMLALGVGAALMPGVALAAGAPKDPPELQALPVLNLPGKDRFSYVRLEVKLLLKVSEELPADVALVQSMKGRISGRLNEQLSRERFTSLQVNSAEVKQLKSRIRRIANDAIGKPIIEDVLIVSLILT